MEGKSENTHKMTTRSKSQMNSCEQSEPTEEIFYDCTDSGTPNTSFKSETDEYETLDENGNLADLIDDSGISTKNKKIDISSLLMQGKPRRKSLQPKRLNLGKSPRSDNNPMNLLLSLLVLKANAEMAKKSGSHKKRIKIRKSMTKDDSSSSLEDLIPETLDEEDEEEMSDISLSEEDESEDEEDEESNESEESEEEEEDEESEESEDEDEESEEEYSFEYDELDEEYEEMVDKHSSVNTEEHDMEYYHYLNSDKKKTLMEQTKKIYEFSASDVPLRFKVVQSDMDMKTKAIAMENIDKLKDMDISTGEHSKMDHWINGLLKIPFGTYKELKIGPSNTLQEKREYIQDAYKTLNSAIYGHKEAKTHILQVIGKWIKNPQSGGNVLAIQGPMGNGKTTLVKEGIAKVLERPFAFIALGGASDSAYFDGHCYTYEGSHWGRIVQILQDSKCMNPVFYFDELDKVSETQKGEEIIHMLTHLTDASQNSLFQDNYFPGVNLDLSKALFIFSYNDENRVNKILKDRMYVIHTKGFTPDDKLKISREYLIPEIFKNYQFELNDIQLSDEILKHIIQNYTGGEEGVRNLKRCIETIVSKVNIYMLTHNTEDADSTKDLSFQLKDFQLPFALTRDNTEILLSVKKTDSPPFHMYC